MNESLVDDQGFPRNDIDVYQVRTARHQIIILQNDLKLLMKEIEKGLQEVHAEEKLNNPNGPTTNSRKVTDEHSMDIDERRLPAPQKNPFVKVNLVSPNSPAEVAVE
jgi:26S proteasome regulatory subunit N4